AHPRVSRRRPPSPGYRLIAPAVMIMGLLGLGRPVAAGAASSLVLDARIDGRPVATATETRPLRLDPARPAVLSVTATNRGATPVEVHIVRLEGRVIGLAFFSFDTAVGLTVPPGGRGSRRFTLDLGGLDGQAIGLIGGSVKLLDGQRRGVATAPVVVDVQGSLWSVYGLFGLTVAFLTVLSFLGALVGLARHRLPPNRWRRALRFLTPGVGLGLVINFTLSATRVFVPRVGRWVSIVFVSSVALFLIGYLSPSPEPDDGEDEDGLLAVLGPGRGPSLPTARALDAAPEIPATGP
ncbi:MAG: hypothetical protein ACRDZW_02000, partial [Acidimicrobiales bacterium]